MNWEKKMSFMNFFLKWFDRNAASTGISGLLGELQVATAFVEDNQEHHFRHSQHLPWQATIFNVNKAQRFSLLLLRKELDVWASVTPLVFAVKKP